MKEIKYCYLITLMIAMIGFLCEVSIYAYVCWDAKECNNIERSRNELIHIIQDDIKFLKWNIEDYGVTQKIYEEFDRLYFEIKNLCLDCPEGQKKRCFDKQIFLHKKLDKAHRLADRHMLHR